MYLHLALYWCLAAALAGMLLNSTGASATEPGSAAEAPTILSARLDPIWTSPLTKDPTKPSFWPLGFLPGAWTEAPSGALALLGRMVSAQRSTPLLLWNAERSGPGAAADLVLPASDPTGMHRLFALFGHPRPDNAFGVVNIAIGADEGVWLGGSTNVFMDVSSFPHSDAYLAKLNGAGTILWQQAYSDGVKLSLSSIVPMAGGGAVVAGSAWHTSWLARIGPDGTRLEEWRLGNAKGIALAPLRDDRVLVAGFVDGGVTVKDTESYDEATRVAVRAGTYRDDVSVWVLGKNGPPQGPTLVREGLSEGSAYRAPGGGAGSLAIATTDDGAYVATNWFDTSRAAGIEIARIGTEGAVVWRRRLPETIEPMDAKRVQTCTPALAALSNGDALVACALNGKVQMHRLDGRTGKQAIARAAPPPCQRGRYASRVSLITEHDGALFALGSGLGDDGDVGCSWMARVMFETK